MVRYDLVKCTSTLFDRKWGCHMWGKIKRFFGGASPDIRKNDAMRNEMDFKKLQDRVDAMEKNFWKGTTSVVIAIVACAIAIVGIQVAQFSSIRDDIRGINARIDTMGNSVSTLQGDIREVNVRLNYIDDSISDVRNEQSGLRESFTDLRVDVELNSRLLASATSYIRIHNPNPDFRALASEMLMI